MLVGCCGRAGCSAGAGLAANSKLAPSPNEGSFGGALTRDIEIQRLQIHDQGLDAEKARGLLAGEMPSRWGELLGLA